MLVLTTMFVGVSQSLPKTSSIKMVDYWLVFNLLIPFVEVLIHTYEDTLRTDETEVNHHGRTVTIGGDKEVKLGYACFHDKLHFKKENHNSGDTEKGKGGKFVNVNGKQFDDQLFSVREDVQVGIN